MHPQKHIQLSQNHMATTFDLTVSCQNKDTTRASQTLSEAHALINRLEDELSEYLPTSPVYKLNHGLLFEENSLSATALRLLKQSKWLNEFTQDAFNCYVKGHLGFGAIGKGFALDQVRTLLNQQGFEDFLLSAGGSSIILSGFAGPGEPWSWGWSWSRNAEGEDEGLVFKHTKGNSISLGISGTHEKGNHLLNPRTGGTRLFHKSTLVAHPSCTMADALSTAFFIMGWDEGNAIFQKLLDPPALALVDSTDTVKWNGSFQNFWGAPIQ